MPIIMELWKCKNNEEFYHEPHEPTRTTLYSRSCG